MKSIKCIVFIMALCMLGGCNMVKDKLPMPSDIPTIMPSMLPSIIPSDMPIEMATESPVALGTFTTEILDTTPSRVHNLQLCATALDGAVIEGGAEFSFNGIVGERTREKGYEEALMLVDGERKPAIGGGVCQISSTLYNAAAAAGMEILERHSHTGEVHYVEIGQDAAVSFGEQDFRFRNPLAEPVKIALTIENTKVGAALYKAVTNA